MPTAFHVNAADLAHILKQIQIAELHAGTNGAPMTLLEAIQQVYGLNANDAAVAPFGLRTVTGEYNNLLAGQEMFGAADTLFPRLLDPVWINDTDGDSIDFDGPGGAPAFVNGNYGGPGSVVDADPRTISNLIANQTVSNPAAVEAWFNNPLALDQFAADHPGMTPMRPGEAITDPATQLTITNSDLANIYNQSPDIGLSPGFNAWMTFFGQFFDHGLDLVTKGGNGTVYIPLTDDDPLVLGADGIAGTADDLPAHLRFMALTRATVTVDANGIPQAENTTTPFVDQNQTYTSHPSHQVFLREYVRSDLGDGNGMVTRNTGHLLDGSAATGSLDGALATWADVKQNAIDNLGLLMDDFFVHNAPLLATDQYGNFIPGAHGYAQVAVQIVETDGTNDVVRNVFVEGIDGGLDLRNLASVVEPSAGFTVTSAQVIGTNHQFIIDIAHHAGPGFVDPDHDPATPPVQQVADFDMIDANGDGVSDQLDVDALTGVLTDANGDNVIDVDDLADVNLDGVIDAKDLVADDHNPFTYDDEMLNSHFITGDGRGNENIALTAVHSVFHSEHNRLVDTYKDTILETAAGGDVSFLNEWLLVDVTEVPADLTTLVWDGARLFQAGRFVTEMQYQHLVFEEFARRIQPNVDPFVFTNDPQIDASIIAEFAHTVYRFGHSMLGDTVEFMDNNLNSTNTSLIDAFLNPQMFVGSGADLNEVLGNIVRGSVYDLGNEMDEFVVPELQTNLLGLPLDLAALNIARGRETGIPSLNETRRQLFNDFGLADLKPYVSWLDFGQHIKHPASLINFIAAYGTHATIEAETTIEGKRNAAMELLGIDVAGFNDGAGIPADRLDFLNATGAYATAELGGMNNIDLWIGGLAEELNEFGGMLGSTFDFIFQYQLEHLQTGDRFYYLSRTQGMNLLNQLEPNSFTDLVMRNSALGDVYATHLNGSLFVTPDQIFELDRGIAQMDPDPVWADPLTQALDPKVVRDYTGSVVVDGNHDFGGTFRFSGGEHVVVGGTEGNDRIYTDKGIDTLWGDGGNDYLNAGMESDNVFGGDGDDIIEDPFGDDVLRGEGGNDVISGGTGVDLLFGGAGNDYIILGQDDKEGFGEDGDDFILGGTGNDLVQGGEGNDWLEGGDGFDVIAGDNSELFFNSLIIGHDIAWGQGGDQDYDLESGDDIAFTGPGIQRFEGMFGFDWAIRKYDPSNVALDMNVTLFNTEQANILRDRFDMMEAASGWNRDDVILGDDRGQLLGGAAAGDPAALFTEHHLTPEGMARINGLTELMGRAVETLYGPGEVDFYNGNILLGGDGNDTITGRGGNDLIDGDSWLNVRIQIDMGNGVLYTAESLTTNRAVAGPNAGRVLDMNGAVMFGGRSLNSLLLDGTINPGQLSAVREILVDTTPANNTDIAVFRGTLAEYEIEGLVTTGPNNSGDIIQHAYDVNGDGWIMVRDLDDGVTGATIIDPLTGLPVTLASRNILTDGTDLVRNIETLQFSDTSLVIGQNTIFWNFIDGTPLADTLPGTAAADFIRGFDGDDIITAGAGNDHAEGGAGNDRIFGWDGNDELIGGDGDDLLSGQGGTDTLNGGAGNDTLVGGNDQFNVMIGGTGNDTYIVSAINNTIMENAGEGIDTVRSSVDLTLGANVENLVLLGSATTGIGNAANNQIFGNSLANLLVGGNGNDRLLGNAGGDTLNGLNGDDRLFGGGGNDVLSGGSGNDHIYGGGSNDLIKQVGGTDGRDIVDGGAGMDTWELTTSAGQTYVIYTRAEAEAVGITGLAAGTEIVVTLNGNANANVIAELDNIEEIVVNSTTVSSPGGVAPNSGASAINGASISVVGDFTTTSLNYNTITVNGSAANDTVDISGLTSAHRLVFNSNGGTDQVIGDLRPQDVVNMGLAAQPPADAMAARLEDRLTGHEDGPMAWKTVEFDHFHSDHFGIF